MTYKSDKIKLDEVIGEVIDEVVDECCCENNKSFIKKKIIVIAHLIIIFIGFLNCCKRHNVSNPESVNSNDGL